LLIIALGVFVWLTARSKNVRSFQFQISIFIVIWVVGEIVDLLREEGTRLFSDSEIGVYIHVLTMAVFSAMIWIRFIMSEKRGKKLADSIEDI
jgi:bacteriorhodopsin